jgi:hypothetical protein
LAGRAVVNDSQQATHRWSWPREHVRHCGARNQCRRSALCAIWAVTLVDEQTSILAAGIKFKVASLLIGVENCDASLWQEKAMKASAIAMIALLAGGLIAPSHDVLARGGGGFGGGGGGFHGGGFGGGFHGRGFGGGFRGGGFGGLRGGAFRGIGFYHFAGRFHDGRFDRGFRRFGRGLGFYGGIGGYYGYACGPYNYDYLYCAL